MKDPSNDLHSISYLKMDYTGIWEKWFEKLYKKYLELKDITEEVRAVRTLLPPRVVAIILSKLEVAREQAEWIGGVDIRALKKILYCIRE